jgi:hypothetical protein
MRVNRRKQRTCDLLQIEHLEQRTVLTAPSITSPVTVSIPENQTVAQDVQATDPDLPAQTLTFSISGGADAALFSINPSTGVLVFLTPPNFEAPTDAGANNIYDVAVTVNDGAAGTDTKSLAITVTGLNDNSPVFTSPVTFNVPENTTAVGVATSTDADLPAQTITYSITGGADSAKFSINPTTGVLTFVTAPNFEIPTDAGANNVYNVDIKADDGAGGSTFQSVAVTVTPVSDFAPVFSSSATFNTIENNTAVGTVHATDGDLPADTLTYSITGGADSALFSINPTTGVLTFLAAPNFEAPTDAGANNVYNFTVKVDDGTGQSATQNIAVTVLNSPPVFSSPTAFNVNENTTAIGVVAAADSDSGAGAVTYSLTGGADLARFSINPTTGALTFINSPNFELPADVGANNIYDLQVTASSGGSTAVQTLTVTVLPVNDNAPVFTSSATATIPENSTAVKTVTATDADLPAQTITYSISGGADSALFSINPTTGVLTFVSAPNFEIPTDAGADNVYNVQITANDGNGSTSTQNMAVTVVNGPPVFSSPATFNVAENTTAVGTVAAADTDTPAGTITYSITGGADSAKFAINPTTGVLTFVTAPNFEAPTDSGTNNVYDVQVTASSTQGGSAVQSVAVTVTAVNDNPPVFSSPVTFTVPENTAVVGNVVAADADLPVHAVTYNITGGVDAAKFTINATTGALSFVAAPDFETPLDAGVDNVYNVEVTANDGQGSTTVQALTVTVTALNDNAPVFSSAATFSVAENTTAVGNIHATDADLPPSTLSYSISGGADAALFQVDPVTGVVTFKAAPNFEIPQDAGANNVYNVTVKADDNGDKTTTQDLVITVTNATEAPTITLNPVAATYYLHKDHAQVSPLATFVADTTTTNFSGAKLVVSITANRNYRDELSIYPKGDKHGQINVKGHRVLYGGVAIGRFTGGLHQDLEVKFNSSVTKAAINQLVKQINFTADAKNSIGSTRTVQMQLVGSDGQTSNQSSRQINVLAPV